MTSSTCCSDVVPTKFFKNVFDTIGPSILSIVNISLVLEHYIVQKQPWRKWPMISSSQLILVFSPNPPWLEFSLRYCWPCYFVGSPRAVGWYLRPSTELVVPLKQNLFCYNWQLYITSSRYFLRKSILCSDYSRNTLVCVTEPDYAP